MQFAEQQSFLPYKTAPCPGSLPAFVSQDAAKNPMDEGANFRVTKAARQICGVSAFRRK
jgi:hypothetical protein